MNYKILALSALIVAGMYYIVAHKKCDVIKELHTHVVEYNQEAKKLFGYDPELELLKTKKPEESMITISAHGYCSSKKLAKEVVDNGPLCGYILALNLPDHDHVPGDGRTITHGTIHEILPFAFAVSKAVQAGADSVNLHGHSAGGGVVINLIGILNSERFRKEFNDIGITQSVRKQMLKAIQNGTVILDTPLKSAEEIIDTYGLIGELEVFAHNYKESNLRPIDSLESLKGLNLKVLIYFENPDTILCNRDDELFVQRLKEANALGTTNEYSGKYGGHQGWHVPLWEGYTKLITPGAQATKK